MQYVDKADLKVTAQMIVDEASAPKSPIHKFFEWNDTEAGRFTAGVFNH